jgi:hypothetical protein
MFEMTTPPMQHDLLAAIAATLTDLSARVERLDTRLDAVVTARPEPEVTDEPADEWVWEGNRAWRRTFGRPVDW